MAQKADQTAYEGEGGGYYAWSVAKTPLLSEFKLGAGNLLLHPHGFALPHYADSSKIGYVVQGACTVGLVSPNSSEEKVVLIKKGDAIPLSMGDISWWFNGGDTDVNIVFLGESAKAQVSGQFTYFFVAGTLGILRGLQPDFVGKAFNLDEKESENIMNSQPAALITKLRNEVIFPKPNKHVSDKIYATIDTPSADIVVKGGGIVNLLTEKELPTIGRIGLSAKFVRLEGNAMLAPSYTADGSIQMIYDVKGSGWVRAAGADGNPALDTKVQEGEMLIVPQFLVAAVVADECGMEIFSVVTSSMPVFGEFAGKTSVWNALHPVVLQSTLNIGQESVEVFKSKNAKTITIVPPRVFSDNSRTSIVRTYLQPLKMWLYRSSGQYHVLKNVAFEENPVKHEQPRAFGVDLASASVHRPNSPWDSVFFQDRLHAFISGAQGPSSIVSGPCL